VSGLIFTKHPFPIPTRFSYSSSYAFTLSGIAAGVEESKEEKKGRHFFFTLERKTKKSLLHPTRPKVDYKLCGAKNVRRRSDRPTVPLD
jgi:hypothetical protein